MTQYDPFELAEAISHLRDPNERYQCYCQPVVDSEGEIISYIDWEEKRKP